MTSNDRALSVDKKCPCGWLLPLSVIAFPEDVEPELENAIPDSCVTLICPVCESEHRFFVAPVGTTPSNARG